MCVFGIIVISNTVVICQHSNYFTYLLEYFILYVGGRLLTQVCNILNRTHYRHPTVTLC